MFYYAAVAVKATPNACNNLGILLAQTSVAEAVKWYRIGLALDNSHVHLYTNLGSALKDLGNVAGAVDCYQKAIALQPMFWIALANLANLWKDFGRVEEAIALYRRSLEAKPDFVEAFCNLVNSLLFICDWEGREANLGKVKEIVSMQLKEGKIPTVLPFHTFTYASLTSWMVREISRRNAERVVVVVENSSWFPGFPRRPARVLYDSISEDGKINKSHLTGLDRSLHFPYPYMPPRLHNKIVIGYVSSDFTNHPLAHLMQSVFGFHDRTRFTVICYSLSPSDSSEFRQKIEKDADLFIDVSAWTVQQIVERIVCDGVHILCNLNGYTKGARNEVFAARPAPIQMAFMGFAGTMGAGKVWDSENNPEEAKKREETDVLSLSFDGWLHKWKGIEAQKDLELDGIKERWIDFMVSDEIACPRRLVCGEALEEDDLLDQETGLREKVAEDDDRGRIYTEAIIYMPHSFFVNDHRQGFREDEDRVIEKLVLGSVENDATASDGASSVEEDELKFAQMALAEDDEDSEDELTDEERFAWRKEEIKRLKMRKEVFPWMNEDTIIYANFNQLYKIDPEIFKTWMKILEKVPNSILWLLRFPPAGEKHLRKIAQEIAAEDVAARLVFTDVAPKHIHIHRGRIADVFLDTPECNAHTTAADILWSGTPIITYPKYDFKMCSRVAASVAYATGSWSQFQIERFKRVRKSEAQQDLRETHYPLPRKTSSTSSTSSPRDTTPPLKSQRIQKNRRTSALKVRSGRLDSTVKTRKHNGSDDGRRVSRLRMKYGIEDGLDLPGISECNGDNSEDNNSVESEFNAVYSYDDEIWEPRGLQQQSGERFKDKSLLGHYMVVNSYDEYEEHAVRLGRSLSWRFKRISSWKIPVSGDRKPKYFVMESDSEPPRPILPENQQIISAPTKPIFFPENSDTEPTHVYVPTGLLTKLRRRLFLTRDQIPLFDTQQWVRNLEHGMSAAFQKWEKSWAIQQLRNRVELELVHQTLASVDSGDPSNGNEVAYAAEEFLAIKMHQERPHHHPHHHHHQHYSNEEDDIERPKRKYHHRRCLWVLKELERRDSASAAAGGENATERREDEMPLQLLQTRLNQISNANASANAARNVSAAARHSILGRPHHLDILNGQTNFAGGAINSGLNGRPMSPPHGPTPPYGPSQYQAPPQLTMHHHPHLIQQRQLSFPAHFVG